MRAISLRASSYLPALVNSRTLVPESAPCCAKLSLRRIVAVGRDGAVAVGGPLTRFGRLAQDVLDPFECHGNRGEIFGPANFRGRFGPGDGVRDIVGSGGEHGVHYVVGEARSSRR